MPPPLGGEPLTIPIPKSNSATDIASAVSPGSTRLSADRLLALKCQVKSYAWGKVGQDSLCAQLAENGLDELEVEDTTPYAELWMGTHPSGPSMIMLTSPCMLTEAPGS